VSSAALTWIAVAAGIAGLMIVLLYLFGSGD